MVNLLVHPYIQAHAFNALDLESDPELGAYVANYLNGETGMYGGMAAESKRSGKAYSAVRPKRFNFNKFLKFRP